MDKAAERDYVRDAQMESLLALQEENEKKIKPLMEQLRQGSERRKGLSPEQIKIADKIEDEINEKLTPLFAERKRIAEMIEGKKSGAR